MTLPKLNKIFQRALFKLIDNLKQGGNGGKIEFILTPRDAPKWYKGKDKRKLKPTIRIRYADGKVETLLEPNDVEWEKGLLSSTATNKGVG